MGGPRHSRERIEIPANLTGDVATVTRDLNFEERRLDTSTKPKSMTEAQLQQARGELNRGFECKLSVEGFDVQHRLSLPSGSYSGPARPQFALRDVFAVAATEPGASKPVAVPDSHAVATTPSKEKPENESGVFLKGISPCKGVTVTIDYSKFVNRASGV